MPLSDEEARLLHQLEQSLAQEDPDFASALRGGTLTARNRRVAALSALGFVAGMGVLFAGAVMAQTWLGVIGFLVMLGAAYGFVTGWRRGLASERTVSSAAPKSSFVDRMEERWQRRRDGEG